MMAKEARERIRENHEKGKDAVLEELKSFSEAMKLATAPPEDILSVIGKDNWKEKDAQETVNNRSGNCKAYKTIFGDSGIHMANGYEANWQFI